MTDRITAIKRCTTVAQLDKLVWSRRNSDDYPTQAEREAWRKRCSELKRKAKVAA